MVKTKLDYEYNEKMVEINRVKRQNSILTSWDGYTSTDIKRDDKINQVIN